MVSSAKQKKRKKGKKTGSRPAREKRAQTIDLTLRLNVQVEQGKKRAQPRRERVKYIRSRKRQNLREMRQSLPGAGGPQAFSNPAFYGNVKMLTDSAMNQFQNKRYALENQLRESAAEQKALQLTGRQEAAQHQGNEVAALQAQLNETIKMFTGVVAHQAGEQGKLKGVAQEKDQAAIEKAEREEALARVQAYTDKELKAAISARPALQKIDWSPGAFSTAKWKEVKTDVQQVLAFQDAQDEADLVAKLKPTHRAQGRTKSRKRTAADEAAAALEQHLDMTPRVEPEPQAAEEEDDPFSTPERFEPEPGP